MSDAATLSDSHQISLRIIDAVKQHPVLYASESQIPGLKFQEFKQKVWKYVADELDLDSTFLKFQWKNLKDTYSRILKYKNKTKRGNIRKKWIFEDSLSFLKIPCEIVELSEDYIQLINVGKTSSEGLLEQLEDKTEENFAEYLEVLDENVIDSLVLDSETLVQTLHSDNSQVLLNNATLESEQTSEIDINTHAQKMESKPKRRKQKRHGNQSIDEVPLKYNIIDNTETSDTNLTNQIDYSTLISQLPREKSSLELFFESMAQTVKKLPPKAQADIKMNICRLVTQAELRCVGKNNQLNSSMTSSSYENIPKLILIPCEMIDKHLAKMDTTEQ